MSRAALHAALCGLLVTPCAHAYDFVMLGTPADRPAQYAWAGMTPDHWETFETLVIPYDTSVPSFAQNGVTYNALTASPLVVVSPGSHGQFAPQLMPTTSSMLTGNGYDHIEIVFDQPVRAVTFDVFTNGLGAANAVFYDQNNAPFFSQFFGNGLPPAIRMVGMAREEGLITRVVFNDVGGELINSGIDNIDWVSAPVPEPATWALWGLGAAALLHRRRRADRVPLRRWAMCRGRRRYAGDDGDGAVSQPTREWNPVEPNDRQPLSG